MSKKNTKPTTPNIQKNRTITKDKKESKYNKTIIYILSAIIILTIIAFFNSIKNGFISNWDDDVYILNNIDIRDLNLTKALHFFSFNNFVIY